MFLEKNLHTNERTKSCGRYNEMERMCHMRQTTQYLYKRMKEHLFRVKNNKPQASVLDKLFIEHKDFYFGNVNCLATLNWSSLQKCYILNKSQDLPVT